MVGNKSAAIDSEFIVNISYRKHASRQTVEVYVVGLKTNFGSAGPRFPAKFCNAVWARKTRMMVYHAVKKKFDDSYSHFETILQLNRLTGRQTDRQKCPIDIACRYANAR